MKVRKVAVSDPDQAASEDHKQADEGQQGSSASNQSQSSDGKQSLVDELGVQSLDEPIFGGRGRLFSVAGRASPVAEFSQNFLVLRPPQKPFEDEEKGEDISIRMDERGVLLDELNKPKKISGAKYKGREVYYLGLQKPGTLRHYAAWFDDQNEPHPLLLDGEAVTTEAIYKLRNKTHDGELSIFPDLTSDE